MSYGFYNPSLTATANISPCRFVHQSAEGCCTQSGNHSVPVIGVSGENTRYMPGSAADDGLHAVAGEQPTVHGPGQVCNVQLGANVTIANGTQYLIATTDGKAIAANLTCTTLQYVSALALQSGLTDDKIACVVLSPFIVKAA